MLEFLLLFLDFLAIWWSQFLLLLLRKFKIYFWIIIRFIPKKMYLLGTGANAWLLFDDDVGRRHDFCRWNEPKNDLFQDNTVADQKQNVLCEAVYSHNGNILFEKVWSNFLQKNIVVKFSCSIVVLIFFSHLNLTYNFWTF